MNREYVASLERVVHASKYNMVKMDNHMKELSKQQKTMKKIINRLEGDKNNLKKLLQYEKEKYICNVCYTKPKDCIIEPCRHFVGCKDCSVQVNKCPICRGEIDSYITLFIP